MLIATVAVVLPFVILSFFNHPQNDDFVFAAQAKALGFANTVIRWYMIWTARYFSVAIETASPVVERSFFAFKFTAAATILLLILSIYYFLGELSAPGISRKNIFLAALTITALYLFKMPLIAQSLYWLGGAASFTGYN